MIVKQHRRRRRKRILIKDTIKEEEKVKDIILQSLQEIRARRWA